MEPPLYLSADICQEWLAAVNNLNTGSIRVYTAVPVFYTAVCLVPCFTCSTVKIASSGRLTCPAAEVQWSAPRDPRLLSAF